MKILYVVEHYHPYIGGVEKLFKTLCESLVQMGHQPIVVTTRHNKSLPLKDKIGGVEIYRLPLKSRFLFTFFAWPWILKYAKGVDLIHTTSYNAALPAFNVAKFYGKKSIITFHEVWGKLWYKVPMLGPMERVFYSMYERFILLFPFTKYVAVSNFTKSELEKFRMIRPRLTTIYNGVDYGAVNRKWVSPNNKQFQYTFFGRLGVSKGLRIMIEGAARFNQEFDNVQFNFVLPKYPKKMYQKVVSLIKESGLNRFNLLHELDKESLDELLIGSDCVVVPSYSEGFGFSALECCIADIPLISSEKGALSEVTSGRIIKMEDTTSEAVYQALCKAKNGEFEIKPDRKFHLRTTVDQYIDLYKEMIT